MYNVSGRCYPYPSFAIPPAREKPVPVGLPRHPSGEDGGVNPPLQIAVDGDLMIKTDGGEMRFPKPLVYQKEDSGARSQESEGYDAISDLKFENRQSSIVIGSKAIASLPAAACLLLGVPLATTFLAGCGAGWSFNSCRIPQDL
jgi:hypothetical protein